MKKIYNILFILHIALLSKAMPPAFDLIRKGNAAITLGNISLFSDTLHNKASKNTIEEGVVLEYLGQTKFEHEDKDGKQKFRWYKVRTNDKKIGWVFGDAVAVMLASNLVEEKLKPFYRQDINFGNGFEKSITWVAAVEGSDNVQKNNFLNPPYSEFYFIVTNDKGVSLTLNYANLITGGKTSLGAFQLRDMTGDGMPEIILQRKTAMNNGNVEDRAVEIYGFQAGNFSKIFDERTTLTMDNGTYPMPSLYKAVDIEKNTIRIAYPDFVACEQYTFFQNVDIQSKTLEKCFEYVTYTYQWDNNVKQFVVLYDESRAPIKGNAPAGAWLRSKPDSTTPSGVWVEGKEEFKVIKQYENYITKNGTTKIEYYLYVLFSDGSRGYLPASSVHFLDIEHAALLQLFYKNPPLIKKDWRTNESFLNIVKRKDDIGAIISLR